MRLTPLLLFLAACSADAPLIDVERIKIEASLKSYVDAAIRFGRIAPADRVDAQAEMTRQRDYLRLLWGHPDGRKYVSEILARMLQERASRTSALSAEERRLLMIRPPPEELTGVARERYDGELAVSALEQLSAALAE